jgi:Pyruvate phosphate dikinase, AMP/ATP-binding domain
MRFKAYRLVLIGLLGCSADPADKNEASTLVEKACTVSGVVDSVASLGCKADFLSLASVPIDSNIPGARSAKVVLDQLGGDTLYFQNSQKYQIHYQFVSTHLSGGALPVVPQLSEFNQSEYYQPDRRFILGAVTYYEEPDAWVLELAPYDTASAAMIGKLFSAVRAQAFFGAALAFHPTSNAVATEAAKLAADISVITTDQLFAKTDFQPLTLGQAVGTLHFVKAADLATEYLAYTDIVVLDEVPNDISVVSGLITEQFQTPLSHVNVLSNNRGSPNMGLRGATTNMQLRALEGKPVELSVSANAWTVREVTAAEAQAFADAHKPTPVALPALDLSVQGLPDAQDLVDESGGNLRDAIKKAVLAFGGKAAQYGVLANTKGLPVRKAFAIPVYYYDQFMRENGFYERIAALLADATFQTSASRRDSELAALRTAIEAAPVNDAFQTLLKDKLAADYPGLDMRFRSSTNSEDLDGFPCAGCYESHTGDAGDWNDVLDAIRKTWSTVWLFRTFEERSYYGINHTSVGMALLVHHNYADEEANGVALTANPYDASGLEPGFYVNVQWGGDAEVVHPPAGVSSDEFLYFFDSPNQPTTYLTHSNLVPANTTVLTARQIYDLGTALSAIHKRFSSAYGPEAGNAGWYAMDVEFKYDDEENPGQPAALYVKQARPHPGRGTSVETD